MVDEKGPQKMSAPQHRYALLIEYDGTNFKGWQKQLNPPVRSVEAVLEEAVSFVANEEIKLVCAGRTDAGVMVLIRSSISIAMPSVKSAPGC